MKDLMNVIEKAVNNVIAKEKKEEAYLNQSNYETCTDRAKAGWEEVGKEIIPYIAAHIASHRINSHGEDFRKAELKTSNIDVKSDDGYPWFS